MTGFSRDRNIPARLGSEEVSVLVAVYRMQSMGQRPCLEDLRRVTSIDGEAVSQLVAGLEKQQLLTIDRSSGDGNALQVAITHGGIRSIDGHLPG
ncbi:hypothetical protein WAB17_12430 [Parerythrobacter aurantius]|uniref:hypothetical protein n=1 Tax=Parerythrobacter aurantius TaxID=3127706 RepID=UPI00324500B6